MDNLKFKISEFAAAMGGCHLDNDITIIKIDPGNNTLRDNIIEEHFLLRLRNDISCSFFINTGQVSATLDYKTYSASDCSILAIPPFKILTQLEASENFSGYILVFTKQFIEESAINRKPPVSLQQLLTASKRPDRELSRSEMAIMKTCLDRVFYYLKNKQHRLRKELVSNTFYTLMLEAVNIIFNDGQQSGTTIEKSIKKNHIQKFMELLIQHAEKEHNPSFYAEKMCISVQYLSLILKEISGRTANAWISGFLITRAKTMLRKPDMTIQQITEILNFSDQSSFGKFFKKHVGISPKKYRESHMSI